MSMDANIKKSLRYSLLDGIFANIMIGASETFIVPYALAMKASASLIGLIVAVPNLIGAFLQVKSATLAETLGSRKALINTAVFIQALMWIPVILIPYIFKGPRAIYLLVLYTALSAAGLIAFPPWSSLMADHVPETQRGKYFGWRNRIIGIVNISAMLLAGVILDIAKNRSSSIFIGFTIIFTIAFVSRLVSWTFLTRMYEGPLVIKDEHRFTFLNFMKKIRRSNFGRFVIFIAVINFAVFMSGPFFAIYMLKDLGFSYITYTIITLTSTLSIFVMMRIWGERADHVGNRRVLRLTSYFLPVIPMLWVVSHNMAYLIAIQIFSGFFWAGFNMSSSNFIYDAVTPEKRTRCIAYFNVVNGIAMFAGATTGGLLARNLPPIFGYRLLSLFVLSGLVRLAALPICSAIREVRQVKHVSNLELFYSIIAARPPSSLYERK